MSFLYKPRHVWLRKIIFQVHLWTGLILGLYMFVIGASGAILVFRQELKPAPPFEASAQRASDLDLPTVAGRIRVAYPGSQLRSVSSPTETQPYYSSAIRGKRGESFVVYVQPVTGQIVQNPDPHWLRTLVDLHFYLLSGKTGLVINGIGASFLLLLCISGLTIWWPGVTRWKRTLIVNFKGGWKRVNWDLHSVVGFWTLAMLSMWAVSGVYFAWPKQFAASVNWISPVNAALPPQVDVPPRSKKPWPTLDDLIRRAQFTSPGYQLASVLFSDTDKNPLVVQMRPEKHGISSRRDYIYFDPSTGRQLALWHRGINPTLGSKVMFWIAPLHFGIEWGLPVKIIWAAFGLGLPVLFLTGALMYWNRTLSKKWRAIGKVSMVHARAAKIELPVYLRTNDRGRLDPKINEVIHAETYEEG